MIKELPTPRKQAQDVLVKHAESILERARNGEIDALVTIEQRPDGTWMQHIVGSFTNNQMIAMLETTKWEFLEKYVKESRT